MSELEVGIFALRSKDHPCLVFEASCRFSLDFLLFMSPHVCEQRGERFLLSAESRETSHDEAEDEERKQLAASSDRMSE